jgi:hypothetical protein
MSNSTKYHRFIIVLLVLMMILIVFDIVCVAMWLVKK